MAHRKGKSKVEAEYSLVFLAYNMRRALMILGVSDLIERVKAVFFGVLALRRSVARKSRDFVPEFRAGLWPSRVGQRRIMLSWA